MAVPAIPTLPKKPPNRQSPAPGHPPGDPLSPDGSVFCRVPEQSTENPPTHASFRVTAFASPPMTHIHTLVGDIPVTAAVPQCCVLPCPSLSPWLPLERSVPGPCRLVVPRYRLLVPSRSRPRFFGSRTAVDPPARRPRAPGPGRTANDDSHARFVHVPMRDASR